MPEDDEGIRETRFDSGSPEELFAFPRLVGNATFAYPVRNLWIERSWEGDHLPAIALSLLFVDEEKPLVASLPLRLAREFHRALGELLADDNREPR